LISFVNLAEFKKTTTEILCQIQASQKVPGKNNIYVADEKEFNAELLVRQQGIPLTPNLQKDVLTMQNELGLKIIDI
jgi:L-2-hydroxycarboxylate dehydrogenase (NAD+)